MNESIKNINEIKPNDIVKTCDYLENGLCTQLDGLNCCCLATIGASLVSIDEIKAGKVSYELIVQRRRELFEEINGLSDKNTGRCKSCANIHEKQFKDVCFDRLGDIPLPAGMNIQHYTQCNERCTYCWFTQHNQFVPPQYDILKIFDLFKEKGKLGNHAQIDFSGGEPALLKDFNKILSYFDDNKMSDIITVFSNASIYSQKFCDLLKENKVCLTTSIDTGIKSHYAKIRGADLFEKVIDTLIKYRNSGTKNLFIKYVITDQNRTDDDMWSFLLAMLAIRPNLVMICPDFPYGDLEIPEESIDFAAKLWYLTEKYLGPVCNDYTFAFGDPKFIKYRKKLAKKIEFLKNENPLTEATILKPYTYNCNCKKKLNFRQKIFSKFEENGHIVVCILGIKMKFRRRKK